MARASRSDGQTGAKASPTYSMMAMLSHTVTSPSTRIGTLPAGECASTFAFVSGRSSGMTISSNAIPSCFISSQGRSDQDE